MVLWFSIVCIFISSRLDYGLTTNVNELHNWDLLIFTQHWPTTVCEEWMEHNKSHSCSFPSRKNSWTIHGIWPTRKGTMGPAFCNRTWNFDPEEVKSIETALNEFWINIEKDTSTYDLWAHEWNKHGTCAAILEPLNSQLKYFSTGLEWVKKYSMTELLSKAGIVPSANKMYSLSNIHQAIIDYLGVTPIIECRKENGYSFLFELRICFDKHLQLVDCEETVTVWPIFEGKNVILTNCDTTTGILYPPEVLKLPPPNTIYVQLYKFVSWLQWFTL